MIKFNLGWVQSNETGEREEIIVQSDRVNSMRDILIGGGMVALGITYLTRKAFRRGAEEYEQAELKALERAGIIKD